MALVVNVEFCGGHALKMNVARTRMWLSCMYEHGKKSDVLSAQAKVKSEDQASDRSTQQHSE